MSDEWVSSREVKRRSEMEKMCAGASAAGSRKEDLKV